MGLVVLSMASCKSSSSYLHILSGHTSLHKWFAYCGLLKSANAKTFQNTNYKMEAAQREYCTMIATKGSKRQNASHLGLHGFGSSANANCKMDGLNGNTAQ